MSISLTPDQEHFIRAKLQAGKYRSAEEVLEVALRLLEEYDRAEVEWIEDFWARIDAVVEASEHTAPVDGETFISGIIERFQQVKQ